ncbi:trypsin-like peptidase domain-containing protein [Alicyclobacillus sp. SO9]|uniref:trypsin-like peptidase domain-containing protein n=1 Tax=Alicyclobacillus sp. SO9 TaxID=2665646 RepID=UPI0018E8FE5C|nr:trypsin-like peptidase domain-containing protein [Alicyclobacillus sp. SO9]QQE77186.1 trypsin-like peptidase domain-containing protein [Alicyclobacillus sp. SO9]
MKLPLKENSQLQRYIVSFYRWLMIMVVGGLITIVTTHLTVQSHHSQKPYQMLTVKPSGYSWAQVRKRTADAVVKIKTYTNGMGVPGTDSNGTGWVTKGGYIITCYHVLSDKHYTITIYPYLNGHNLSDKVWYRAKVVKANERTDLALLKVIGQPSTPFATLSTASGVNAPGSHRLVLGFPRSNSLYSLMTRTGLPHFVSMEPRPPLVYAMNNMDPSQAAGLSGAPVLNHSGRVVGIVDVRQGNNHKTVSMIPVKYLRQWNIH